MSFQNPKFCFLFFPLLKSNCCRTKAKQAAFQLIIYLKCTTVIVLHMWYRKIFPLDTDVGILSPFSLSWWMHSYPGTVAQIHRVQNRKKKLSIEVTERVPSVMSKCLILTSMLLGERKQTGYRLCFKQCSHVTLHQHSVFPEVFFAPGVSLLLSFSNLEACTSHTLH